MVVGVPRETAVGERRVALVPETAKRLAAGGVEIAIERGAGEAASFLDAAYAEAGARTADDVFAEADVVCKVQKPAAGEVERLREGTTLVGLLAPLTNPELVRALAAAGAAKSLERSSDGWYYRPSLGY